MGKARNYIRNFSPYSCLLLLGAPLAIVEPLKLAAIFIFGTGHWITGSLVMLLAYSVSLLVVERLFKIVKPKLLTLRWFVVIWTWFVATRDKAFRWFQTKLSYRGRAWVRFGSKADICSAKGHVRFTPRKQP
jgi:hypothetical protein